MISERECEMAIEQFENELMRKANVVGIGIVEHNENRQLAVGVYVSQKESLDRLKPEDIVPRCLSLNLDSETIDVHTQVIEQGVPRLE